MKTIEIKDNIITIEGTIGVPEQWQFDDPQERVATYEAFRAKLTEIEQMKHPNIEVHIRSTGGDVNDALLIWMALNSLTDTHITTKCYGYIANAATVIAQAGHTRLISPNALYLIHACTCSAEGTSKDLMSKARLLENTDERLLCIYMDRAGLDDDSTFRKLMFADDGKGQWLNATETIEYGLADAIIEPQIEAKKPKSVMRKIGEMFGLQETKLCNQ